MYQLQLLCRRFLAALALMMVLTAVDAPALGRSALAQVEEAAAPGFGPAVAGMIDPAAVSEPERAARFPDLLHAHVDVYWSDRFAESGRSYRPPAGVVGFTTTIDTGCGLADPETETAFYCILDETIYYSVEFRRIIDENIGDFGWVTVVAHEWGHHIQTELGLFNSGPMRANDGTYAVTFELQADCLAGAYTQDAEARGWLDPGDIDEAILLTTAAGDPTGTTVDNPNAHGTSAQRVDAFLTGYQEGLTGCDLDLAA